MKVLAIINAKGGTGKTTTAAALAQVFSASMKREVLLVDCDPQNDLSTQFGRKDSDNLFRLLTGDIAWDETEVITTTKADGISIVPSGYNLYGLELASSKDGKKVGIYALENLAEAVASKGLADIMIVDCPPHFTPSSVAALIAADAILIPTTSDAHSINGMGFLFNQIEELKGGRTALERGGVFLTMWERGQVATQVEAVLRQRGYPLLNTHIRRSQKAVESTYATGHAVTDYSKRSSAGRDYVTLAQELAEKWGWS